MALGLDVGQGINLTETFYWRQDSRIRREIFEACEKVEQSLRCLRPGSMPHSCITSRLSKLSMVTFIGVR
jgi:hypothetical protein